MNELKPCPFCGGEASKVRGVGFKVHGVVCTKCPCEFAWFSSEKQAIAAWNARAERTCQDVHKECFFQCSNCGCTVQLMCDFEPTIYIGKAIVPNYCPNCGAKVVE